MDTDLGYNIHHPDEHSGPEWEWQLDVNLFEQPTNEHFDPERLDIWIVERAGDVASIAAGHPWRKQKQLNICAGRIILHDRKNKAVEIFAFGGKLEILSQDSYTRCQITSPAPIIQLSSSRDIPTLFVCELEAILACLEARWAGNETGFKRKLAGIEPCILFAAGATAVQQRLSRLPATPSRRQLLHFLDRTIQTVQANGKWPVPVASLDSLL